MDKPEALRLADALMDYYQCSDHALDEAAAELRRLHAENERLHAQRDALLEALKTYGWHAEDCPQYPTWTRPEKWPDCTCGFDAAIAAVEGEKT